MINNSIRKKVLGVNIDDISMEEAVETVTKWLENGSLKKSKILVTPGPEFLVTAQRDHEFKEILNSADLAVPDGFGLKVFGGIRNRLCGVAAEKGWQVGLLGGKDGVAHETASKLLKQYPNINISVIIDGKEADKILSSHSDSQVFLALRRFSRYPGAGSFSEDAQKSRSSQAGLIDIFFVALGHPKQEKFLAFLLENKFKFPISNFKFRVGMGVGGSFDFISGRIWEPGKWMSALGLKWLGRLISNPRHIFRVWTAVVIFPFMVLRGKFSDKN